MDLDTGFVLVTGASGQIGRQVCSMLRATGRRVLPIDKDPDADGVYCDVTSKESVERLYREYPVRAVIHLAAVLPTIFHAAPLAGAEVNLTGSVNVLSSAARAGIRRFVFGSSLSVYGLSQPSWLAKEDNAVPDEPYGGSKRAIELIGDKLARNGAIEFFSLRIARVIGPGSGKTTSSPWRSQILENGRHDAIRLPYAPEARLALVHVEDVARMLIVLLDAENVQHSSYNTVAEVWTAAELKEAIESVRRIKVDLMKPYTHGGPICDGALFGHEFNFAITGLRDRLQTVARYA
jgi:nucleoside-diphosphate-sugar epimerase